MGEPDSELIFSSLNTLLDRMVAICERLHLPSAGELSDWSHALRRQVFARFSKGFPLTIAVTGGGSTGKSTLFNSLCGSNLSPVGGKAGINRRVLAALHPEHLKEPGLLEALFAAFETDAVPLADKMELTRPGPPLFTVDPSVSPGWVLLDTPDFDTGDRGTFENRSLAEPALSTADVLIYLFTNITYNNRENTEFIGRVLSGFGYRPCFLVYRAPEDVPLSTLSSHARVVARNIYGDKWERYVLGMYWTREDNAVAAGRRLMTTEPLSAGALPLVEALSAIETTGLRLRFYADVLAKLSQTGQQVLSEAGWSLTWLDLYKSAVASAESLAVKTTLEHFPMNEVLERFARIWMASDPVHIKAMRQTGKVLDFPVKTAVRTVKWISRTFSGAPSKAKPPPLDPLETDLTTAANRLRGQLAGPFIDTHLSAGDPNGEKMRSQVDQLAGTLTRQGAADQGLARYERFEGGVRFHIPAHPGLAPCRQRLRNTPWQPVLEGILAQKETLSSLSSEIERELHHLASEMRARQGLWGQARQTVAALLNIVPMTAAVTYIFTTGDPVGAAGIKVKLAALFGLHDLYALVALPATSGLKAADQRQLMGILAPVAQAWLNSRMGSIQSLFRRELTGTFIETAERLIKESQSDTLEVSRLLHAVDALRKEKAL